MRLVIKVGSNVLTRDNGKLDITRMSALVDQVAALRAGGHEVILVSSGAVACGRSSASCSPPSGKPNSSTSTTTFSANTAYPSARC